LPTHGNGEVPVLGKLPYSLSTVLLGYDQWCVVFFLWFFVFRPGGTTKTYPEANSSGCWMKALKVDENGFKWMKNGQNGWIFGYNNVFLGPNFAKIGQR
jgi:hypothetical protein